MKVILLKDVENVGKKYEVKDVKPGFARNFLIAQNLAKLASESNLEWLESQREVIQKEVEEDLKASQELASQLDDLEVVIVDKVNDEGHLFDSVNAQKISEKLKEMGFEVKKSQINLEKPIKEVGEFAVKIALPHNLEAEIKVVVSKEA